MKKLTPLALAGLLVCACSVEPGPGEAVTAPVTHEVDSTSYIPGEIIVEFSDDMIAELEKDLQGGRFLHTKSGEVNSVFGGMGVTAVERLYPDAGEWEPRHREAGLHKWYRIKFDPAMPQTKAVSDISEIPGLVYAGRSPRIKPSAIFNDPSLSKQWHYINNGTLTPSHKKGCDINVEPVWAHYTGGSSDVIVAVVDGGVDLSHEDLGSVVIPGGSNGSRNFVSNSYQIVPHSHGTHVAGTIGAINNNGKGVCGIAGGLDGKGGVRIMSCQVFEPNPSDPEHDKSGGFYEALVWAADHGAVIANNSWGNVYDSEADALKGGVGGMKGAIDYFIKYAGVDKDGNQTGPMKGGLVVFAAGNEGWKMGWPAAYDAVVAVGAVAPDFTRAYYSNYGDWVDIAAPGGSQQYDNGNILSTVPDNKYAGFQGTSMACPHVAGVAALIVSQFGGPGFTCDMLKERLLGGVNASVLSKNAQIGSLVDVLGSFSYGSTKAPEAVGSYSVTQHSNFLDFAWNVTKDPDDKVAYGYMLMASEDRSLLENIDFRNIPSAVSYVLVPGGDKKVGAAISGTLTVPGFETPYYVAVAAYDYSKNYSVLSEIKTVVTGPNTPPVISCSQEGTLTLKAFQTANVDFHISDPDGHAFTISLTPGSAAVSEMLNSGGTYKLNVNAQAVDAGKYEALVTASDAFGASTTYTLVYEILENHAPEAKGNIENLLFTAPAQKKALDMSDYIEDPDGEQLVYTIDSSPKGIVHLNQVDNTLNLTTLDYGLAHVVITGTDAKGLKATVDLKVLVRDPSSLPDIYPTTVTDILNVSDGEEKTLSISISNAAGAELYSNSATCDAFSPAAIDLSGWAPGVYTVRVVSGDKTRRTNIVKL